MANITKGFTYGYISFNYTFLMINTIILFFFYLTVSWLLWISPLPGKVQVRNVS